MRILLGMLVGGASWCQWLLTFAVKMTELAAFTGSIRGERNTAGTSVIWKIGRWAGKGLSGTQGRNGEEGETRKSHHLES